MIPLETRSIFHVTFLANRLVLFPWTCLQWNTTKSVQVSFTVTQHSRFENWAMPTCCCCYSYYCCQLLFYPPI